MKIENIIKDKKTFYQKSINLHLIEGTDFYYHAVIHKEIENIARDDFNIFEKDFKFADCINSKEVINLTKKYKNHLLYFENFECKIFKYNKKNNDYDFLESVKTTIKSKIKVQSKYIKFLPSGYIFDLYSNGDYYIFKDFFNNYAFIIAGGIF